MSLLEEFVANLPVFSGEKILFSSDIVRLGIYLHRRGEELDLSRMVSLLLEKVGSEGTLLFPTYNWGFCSGEAFDYWKTPSKTGSLSQTALSHKMFKRTKHPIYSWAVAGKDKDMLCSLNNTESFGKDSIFAWLLEVGGKNILLDVSMQNSFTFVHFVEQYVGVPYRYHKDFTAKYIDEEGQQDARTYSMFVRDYELDAECELNPLESFLVENKLVELTNIYESRVLKVDFQSCFNVIKNDIEFNKAGLIARYKGQ